jgi:hypothetical protein
MVTGSHLWWICDDFHLVTELASHLCICDEMSFFVTDVVLICDEKIVVMDLNSIYDERCASWIQLRFRHYFPCAWLPDCLTAPLTALVVCNDQIWSQMFLCFGHNLPLTVFASDVVLTSAMTWQLTWRWRHQWRGSWHHLFGIVIEDKFILSQNDICHRHLLI